MALVDGGRPRILSLAIITTAILCGIALRIRGLTTEFWLDEIWSLRFAQEARSLFEVYVAIPSEGNHLLNTTYLYLIGNHANWVWYRLFSFACGLVTIALMIRAARTGVLLSLIHI